MIKDVTDLEVYQESLRLLEKLYEFLKKVPASEYDTVRQCKKCGKSIPAQIAEGFAKVFGRIGIGTSKNNLGVRICENGIREIITYHCCPNVNQIIPTD